VFRQYWAEASVCLAREWYALSAHGEVFSAGYSFVIITIPLYQPNLTLVVLYHRSKVGASSFPKHAYLQVSLSNRSQPNSYSAPHLLKFQDGCFDSKECTANHCGPPHEHTKYVSESAAPKIGPFLGYSPFS